MILELMSLIPVQRGILALLIAGLILPLCGIPLVEMNLLPLRIMLMHGAIFAGTIAMILGASPTPFMVGVNVLFILIMTWVSEHKTMDMGRLSAFFMVTSLGGASLLSHRFGISGQGVQNLLWGSPFLLTSGDLILFIIWATVILILFLYYRKIILLVLFDSSSAEVLGVNTRLYNYLINVIVAISVALVMKLLGAMLVDVLLLIPVVLAGFWKKGFRNYIRLSILFSILLVLTGIIISLFFDLPVSGVMALSGSFIFLMLILFKSS